MGRGNPLKSDQLLTLAKCFPPWLVGCLLNGLYLVFVGVSPYRGGKPCFWCLDALRGFYMGVIWVVVGFLGFGNQNFFCLGCLSKCAFGVCVVGFLVFKEIYLQIFCKKCPNIFAYVKKWFYLCIRKVTIYFPLGCALGVAPTLVGRCPTPPRVSPFRNLENIRKGERKKTLKC